MCSIGETCLFFTCMCLGCVRRHNCHEPRVGDGGRDTWVERSTQAALVCLTCVSRTVGAEADGAKGGLLEFIPPLSGVLSFTALSIGRGALSSAEPPVRRFACAAPRAAQQAPECGDMKQNIWLIMSWFAIYPLLLPGS